MSLHENSKGDWEGCAEVMPQLYGSIPNVVRWSFGGSRLPSRCTILFQSIHEKGTHKGARHHLARPKGPDEFYTSLLEAMFQQEPRGTYHLYMLLCLRTQGVHRCLFGRSIEEYPFFIVANCRTVVRVMQLVSSHASHSWDGVPRHAFLRPRGGCAVRACCPPSLSQAECYQDRLNIEILTDTDREEPDLPVEFCQLALSHVDLADPGNLLSTSHSNFAS